MKIKIGDIVFWKGTTKMLVCEVGKHPFPIGCKFWDSRIYDRDHSIRYFKKEELHKPTVW